MFLGVVEYALLVTGTGVVEFVGGGIENPIEDGSKHGGEGITKKDGIDLLDHSCCVEFANGIGAEGRAKHSHDHASPYTVSRYIGNNDTKTVCAYFNKVVVVSSRFCLGLVVDAEEVTGDRGVLLGKNGTLNLFC